MCTEMSSCARFRDRKEAGEVLGEALNAHRGGDALVLGVPKGGIEVGMRSAEAIGVEFSIVVVRKLPLPDSPEAGFGAIAEDGSLIICEKLASTLGRQTVERVLSAQWLEIKRRILLLRAGGSLPRIEARTVILIDDGIAMGSTMRAAIALCRKKNPEKLVVAVPVASEQTAREIAGVVDELIVLEKPSFFVAVAQAYENWYDVTDAEAIRLLKECGVL
jgi:putative phosphoribosyl transferase